MWVCNICGSNDIQVRDWINVNDRNSDCTDFGLIDEDKDTYCLNCEQVGCGIKWRKDD